MDEFYKYFSVHQGNSEYEFDLSDVEWMSNQELLILTSIFKYLVESEIKFKVFFLKNGSTELIERRIAVQIYQIWEVWKIANIMHDQKFEDYFDIHSGIVDQLKNRFKLNSTQGEIYNRFGITPFVSLDSISHYDNRIINEMLEETYRLSNATDNILRLHNCNMPFENHTLSSIITKELYENFLDHVNTSFFPTNENFTFLSLSLVPKISNDKNNNNRIQSILERNFNEESYPEFKEFYFNKKNKEYKNQSILQFSFLDFGTGIISTLKDEYSIKFPQKIKKTQNLLIVKY
ncbi:hypothetical protein [Sphingobacterium sp. IITKGP-BTPF85]|uniref:hypothetical protein n=1 Tax=Sphingobacterium sp. IITKGP-BTPF85 TaxID=1338009 RepID=UPI00038A27D5|nr:hypothetical protein [Sphingobacterium sp. IITKGP-BTPF85]KKX47707.1 hypothetical protein L950_0224985 [Sphingobacterium sp. IITKGP-BTPF85]